MAGGNSGNLDSAPAVTLGLSVCRAWGLRGGAADLLSSRQERPRCPGPSRSLPVLGEAGSWAVSQRPVLWGLRCWIRAPSEAAPSARSCTLSPAELLPGAVQPPSHGASAGAASELLPGPALCVLQPFRGLGRGVGCALPWAQVPP